MCLSEKKRKVLQRANVRSDLLENRGVFESVLSFQLARLISKETEARYILSTTYAWNQILQREDVCTKADGAGHLPSHPAWCWLAQGQKPLAGETCWQREQWWGMPFKYEFCCCTLHMGGCRDVMGMSFCFSGIAGFYILGSRKKKSDFLNLSLALESAQECQDQARALSRLSRFLEKIGWTATLRMAENPTCSMAGPFDSFLCGVSFCELVFLFHALDWIVWGELGFVHSWGLSSC